MDNYVLGKKMMDVSHERQKVYSANLANIETPGYKRMEIDPSFESNLMSAVHRDRFDDVHKMDVRVRTDRESKPTREDGNNVELNAELLRINQNAMDFEFLSQYVSNNIKALNKAIRGHL